MHFWSRFSETAARVDPDTRLPAPRYWLLHTLSHVLIREMAMACGYGAASLSERIYGWPVSEQRDGAAGLLICTTALIVWPPTLMSARIGAAGLS